LFLSAGIGESDLQVSLGTWVVLLSLALGCECLEVLHGVGIWLSTGLSVLVDDISVAIEVFNVWVGTVSNILHESREDLIENAINVKSVSELLHECLLGLFGWVVEDINVEVVEFDVSGVDGEVVPFLVDSQVLWDFELILDQIFSEVFQVRPEILWCGNRSSLEISNWLSGNGNLTPLKNVRFGGEFLDGLVLHVHGLLSHLTFIGIFQPVD
jgi:hypothetical protein